MISMLDLDAVYFHYSMTILVDDNTSACYIHVAKFHQLIHNH